MAKESKLVPSLTAQEPSSLNKQRPGHKAATETERLVLLMSLALICQSPVSAVDRKNPLVIGFWNATRRDLAAGVFCVAFWRLQSVMIELILSCRDCAQPGLVPHVLIERVIRQPREPAHNECILTFLVRLMG